MDPQGPNHIPAQQIVDIIEENMMQFRQQMPDPGTYTIFPFPDLFLGIDDGIRSPQIASFGLCNRDRHQRFERWKSDLLSRFLSRTESLERDFGFYFQKLMELKENIKRCYSEKFVMPPDDDQLVEMLLIDGSFMVEIFLEYDEDRDVIWPWPWPVETLIADLLKLENQLPFFILQKLFDYSNVGQRQSASTRPSTLPNLALNFLNQAFCCPSDHMVNSDIVNPKHLLDLFRLSLLPSTDADPQRSNHDRWNWMHSIQSVKYLRTAGITVRQKTAKSLLEIDFRKFQIPPLALKIPSVAIDDFSNAILVNCVALEQCLPYQSKHFSAYVCFMSCLMKHPDDVGYLRSVDIIKGFSQDETRFINMLNGIGTNVSSSVRDCYLWKQFREIHSYYNSCWASIRRTLLNYNNIMLYCSLLQIAVGILSWRLSGNASKSSVPNK